MSTIKVNRLENTSTANGGIDIDSSGHVQVEGLQLPTAGALSNRSLIINGAMGVDQRNDSSAVTTSGSYVCDRFQIVHSSNGAFSAQQIVEAPDEFKTSLKVTTTTDDSSGLTGSQQLVIRHLVEGLNTIHSAFGKSAAKTLSLSFWVQSSLTGTFGGAVSNSAENRSYVYSYTIDTANTWEYKTIAIPGDTSGTWLVNNGIGIRVNWSLGTGPDVSESAGSWYASSQRGVTGGTSVIDTLNATWQITGVQLEVGSKATPFEHESYSQTLQKCLRYFFKPDCEGGAKQKMMGISYGTSSYYMPVDFPVPMRVGPSVPTDSGATWRARANNVDTVTADWATHGTATTTNQMIAMTGSGTIAAATPFWFETHSDSGCSLEFEAEL